MLSREAESIYWMGRYIERAEDTARLVNVNTNLLLDLPKNVRFGWEELIAITGSQARYNELYKDGSERYVLKFIIRDERNPDSIWSSLQYARENARTIREMIPREAWEQINELYLQAKAQLTVRFSQRGRYDYLRAVILGCQLITGILAGTMTNDLGYQCLRLGRNLERADMTSRIVDVRSANLLPQQDGNPAPFKNILWMSVLNSLTGYQMYRRTVQGSVKRRAVLKFLLQDAHFPRAFYHCLGEVEGCLLQFPRNDAPLEVLMRLQSTVTETDPGRLSQEALHTYIDQLQLGLSDLHRQINGHYFSVTQVAPQEREAQTAEA